MILTLSILVTVFRASESTETDWRSSLATRDLSVLLFKSENRLSELAFNMVKMEKKNLEQNNPPILVKYFNCKSNGRAECSEFGIEKTPVIHLYRKGKFYKTYKGRIEGKHFRNYVTRLVGPLVTRLGKEEDLEPLVKTRFNTIVCFCQSSERLFEIFERVAHDKADQFNFATFDGIFDKYNASQNSVVMLRPKILRSTFEPDYLTYGSDANEQKLSDWIARHRYGLFHIRTKENYQDFSAPLVAAYMFVNEARISDFKFWRNRLLKVSIEFIDRFHFVINDLEDFYQDLDTFGQFLNPTEKPIVCLMSSNHLRFPMVEEFTVENYRSYLKGLVSRGTARAYLQSDAQKPDDDLRPVKRVVGSRFVELVIKNNRDSFLLICLPPMKECSNIEAAWTELATGRLKNEPIDYLSLDMRNNSWSPAYLFEGHPTVYWAGRYSKTKPFLYQDDFTADAFFYFIAERSTEELKDFDRKGRPKVKNEEVKDEL